MIKNKLNLEAIDGIQGIDDATAANYNGGANADGESSHDGLGINIRSVWSE